LRCNSYYDQVGNIAYVKHGIAALAIAMILSAIIIAQYMEAVAFASSSATVAATLTISLTCMVTLSNTAINFGAVSISGNAPTANTVRDANNGNMPANILLSGTNWVYSSNSFFAANTIWDFSSHASGVSGNTLGLSPGNIVDTYNVIGESQDALVYFGVQIPGQQAVGIYTQTVTIENKC